MKVTDIPPRIKVIFLPKAGPQVPDFVSQGFVGNEFPVMERIPVMKPCPERLSYGYKIDKSAALRILERKSPEAARWIEHHPEIFQKSYLIINEEACQPVGFCQNIVF
jgi:hypothetical protein